MLQSPDLVSPTTIQSPKNGTTTNEKFSQQEPFHLLTAAINSISLIEKRCKRKILGKITSFTPELSLKVRFLMRTTLTALFLFTQAILLFPSFFHYALLFLLFNVGLLYLIKIRDFNSMTHALTYAPPLICFLASFGESKQYFLVLAISYIVVFTNSSVALSLSRQAQSYGLLALSYYIHCMISKFNIQGVFNVILIGASFSMSASQFLSTHVIKSGQNIKILLGKVERRDKKIVLLEGEKKELDQRLSMLAAEIRQKTEDLSLAVNSREIFLNTVSSELRNPLNSLIGYIDLLSMELKDSSSLENLENAKHCSELLLCLINNLLDGAKIHAGKLDLHIQPQNIFWFIEKLWAVASPNIKVKNLNGIILVSKNVPPVLEFDQHRLMQICLNLLHNSIKFTQKGYVKVRFSWTVDIVRESPALGNRGIFARNVAKKGGLTSAMTMSYLPQRIGEKKSMMSMMNNIYTSKTSEDLPNRNPKSISLDVESIQARKRFKEFLNHDKRTNFFSRDQDEVDESSINSASNISDSVKSITIQKITSRKNSYDSAIKKHGSKHGDSADPSLPPISDSGEDDESTTVSDQVTKHSSAHGPSLKDIRMKDMDFDELNFNIRRFKKEVHKRQQSPPQHDFSEMAVINEDKDERTAERGKLFIEITDSGCGISREAQDRIFSPFEQGDSSITRKFGGSGMGLYITKQLVEKMGGSIKVESEIDVGSYIMISIPLRTSSASVTPSFNSLLESLPDENKSRKRVLVVDDSSYNRDILEKFFKKYKLEVRMAKNGDEAVQIYSKHPEHYFSLITMDLEMPVMDGLTACKMIRKLEKENNISKKIPIAIISGNIEEREFCLDPNGPIAADYYFRKPVTFADLDSFVPKLLLDDKPVKPLGSKCGVLIVDDDVLGIQFLQNFFKKYGCECSLATDGEIAMETVQRVYDKLDLILFNCEVPKNSNMEAALAIKKYLESKQKNDTKIVVLSGRIDEKLKRHCDKLGFNFLLSKPVKVQLLKQLLHL